MDRIERVATALPTAVSLADLASGGLRGRDLRIDMSSLSSGAFLPAEDSKLAGKSILLAARSQLFSGAALVDLDGVVRRIVILPQALSEESLEAIVADAEIDYIVTDDPTLLGGVEAPSVLSVGDMPELRVGKRERRLETQWILLTSGTSGRPKMVVHSLHSLTGAVPRTPTLGRVWSTFYDIRRYGGLQIFFRALLGGAELALTDPDTPVVDELVRLGALGVDAISGTPSHWRRVLTSAERGAFAPSYIRLSGEAADQRVLDGLYAAFPGATIEHVYAATETGVGFVVSDGKPGFAASLFDAPPPGIAMKIEDGTLRIRSERTASDYLNRPEPLRDSDGYVDSADLVDRQGDRCFFMGRRGGMISVGGLKVSPEEVERVLNAHPAVSMSRAFGMQNPIIGAIVIAEIVPKDSVAPGASLTHALLMHCRERLERHKAPAAIRIVDRLPITEAGKLSRDPTRG